MRSLNEKDYRFYYCFEFLMSSNVFACSGKIELILILRQIQKMFLMRPMLA